MSLTLPPLTATTIEGAISQLKNILSELEGQVSSQPKVALNATSTKNAVVVDVDAAGRMHVGRANDKGRKRYLTADDLQVLEKLGTNYLSITEDTVLPALPDDFPNQYDWGFWHNTAAGNIYLVINMNGAALRRVQLT